MTESPSNPEIKNVNYTLIGIFFGLLFAIALENLIFFIVGLVIGVIADMYLKKYRTNNQ
ncbi:MAG: hypothetical protein PVF74_11715 [Anaerolineales bacterium]|jgi:hypothetical protein